MQSPRVILVALDYSPLSEAALHKALRMTEAVSYATIHAVTVGERLGDRVRLPDGTTLYHWSALDAVRTHLRERVRALPGVGARNLRVMGHVRTGDPIQGILDLAFTANVEHIVVGAHSREGMHRLDIGRVAGAVVSRASVQVSVEMPVAAAPAPRRPFDPLRWANALGPSRATSPFGLRRAPAALKA